MTTKENLHTGIGNLPKGDRTETESLFARLRQVKIDGPEDFSESFDQYLRGEKQVMTAARDDLLQRITVHPDLLNGKPSIRGKRISVETILEFLAAGETREEILLQYPALEPEDIDACLVYAAERDRLEGSS